MKRLLSSLWLVLYLPVFLTTAVVAQDSGGFYAGKTISMVVGVSPGGGYDQYARLLARHLGRHIPGIPAIVVRNMPGAGSLNAVLYTSGVAPPDGLTITMFNSGLLNESIADGDKAKVRFDQVSWVGSLARDLRICFASKQSNIRALEDIVNRSQAVFGGAGPNASSTNSVAMLRNLFGLKIKIISAYRGNTEMNLAVERGEVDGSCISWSSIPEHWLKSDLINILARLSRASGPDIPANAPFIGDLASTQEQRDIIDFLLLSGEVGRPVIVSNKVSADRIAILRRAFDETVLDEQFIQDASRLLLEVSPVGGEEAERLVGKLYSFSSEMVAKAQLAIKD